MINVNFNKDVAKDCLARSLDQVERYFSLVTGAPCRACIKTIISNQEKIKPITPGDTDHNKLIVRTFARSLNSNKTNEDTKNDTVENNTKFRFIYLTSEPYCLIGNIDDETHYLNSHLDTTITKKRSSQLGYKSTLTFAIRTKINNSSGENKFDLWGFLCIDTKTSNVFSKRWDI